MITLLFNKKIETNSTLMLISGLLILTKVFLNRDSEIPTNPVDFPIIFFRKNHILTVANTIEKKEKKKIRQIGRVVSEISRHKERLLKIVSHLYIYTRG